MSLKKTLTASEHSALDETLKALYTEKDGKFHLDIEGDDNLARALENERKSREDLEKKVKRWEKLGKSDEEIAALIAEHDKLKEKEAKESGNFESLRQQLQEKHDKELQAKDAEITKLKGSLQKALIDTQALAAIGAHKGVPDLLLPHIRSRTQVVEENGEFQVRVTNPDGTPKIGSNNGLASIEDLVVEMKGHEVFGRAFDGEGKGGSGKEANGGGGRPAAHGITNKSQFKTERERADFVDKYGNEAYRALPA